MRESLKNEYGNRPQAIWGYLKAIRGGYPRAAILTTQCRETFRAWDWDYDYQQRD
jgi:hypothetical protein